MLLNILRDQTSHFRVLDATYVSPRLGVAILLDGQILQPVKGRVRFSVFDLVFDPTV
jgi:hypothetical protein